MVVVLKDFGEEAKDIHHFGFTACRGRFFIADCFFCVLLLFNFDTIGNILGTLRLQLESVRSGGFDWGRWLRGGERVLLTLPYWERVSVLNSKSEFEFLNFALVLLNDLFLFLNLP